MVVRILMAFLLFRLASFAAILPADRTIDWDPGVRGGITSPSTVFCTVTSSIPGTNIVAYGNGSTDDYAALKAAVLLCPSNQVVYLPAGIYMLSATLDMTNNGVVLRGAPNGKTILRPKGSITRLISIGSNPSPNGSNTWTAGFAKGTTNLTLGSVSGISIGDVVVVATTNNVNAGSDPYADWPLWAVGSTNNSGSVSPQVGYAAARFSCGWAVLVTNISGSDIFIDPPLYVDMTNGNNHVFKWGGFVVKRVGLENLVLEQGKDGNAGAFVEFFQAMNCWGSNIVSKAADSIHTRMTKSLWCSWIDSDHLGANSFTSNAGYGLELYFYTSSCLVQNNLFTSCLNAVQISTSSGNVIAYNFTTNNVGPNDMRRMSFDFAANHGAHPVMNLWEGNKGDKTFADYIHGTSSHTVYLRNHFRGWGTNATATNRIYQYATCAAETAFGSRYYSFIGNVLAVTNIDPAISFRSFDYEQTNPPTYVDFNDPACYRLGYFNSAATSAEKDTNVLYTMFRYNNYVAYTNGPYQILSAEVSGDTTPDSYYLDSQPAWWGSTYEWPPIGPGRTNITGTIPAEARYRYNVAGFGTRTNNAQFLLSY